FDREHARVLRPAFGRRVVVTAIGQRASGELGRAAGTAAMGSFHGSAMLAKSAYRGGSPSSDPPRAKIERRARAMETSHVKRPRPASRSARDRPRISSADGRSATAPSPCGESHHGPTVNSMPFDNEKLFGAAKPGSRPQNWAVTTWPGRLRYVAG